MESEAQLLLLEAVADVQVEFDGRLVERIEDLVSGGADVNHRYEGDGQTPIHLLCRRWMSLAEDKTSVWLSG